MIQYLTANFAPGVPAAPALSLAIQAGREGARLSHSHDRQYHYVLQSLTLWREISHEMFKLWWVAGACSFSGWVGLWACECSWEWAGEFCIVSGWVRECSLYLFLVDWGWTGVRGWGEAVKILER